MTLESVWRSRYSDSLRTGRSVDRIPVIAFRTYPDRLRGPTSLLYSGYRVSFPGVKRPGRGVNHPPHLVCRGSRKRVVLYSFLPKRSSRPIIGWNLHFTLETWHLTTGGQWKVIDVRIGTHIYGMTSMCSVQSWPVNRGPQSSWKDQNRSLQSRTVLLWVFYPWITWR